ncbi:MAG: hypothetical protein J6T92_06905 [Ottowia sp.]|nr:hypothetical protein [Ottowia sp.]
MSKYDALRAEYVTGTMTLRELATAHGESYDGLRTVAARQCWSRLRHEHALRVQKRAEDEAIERSRAWCADDVAAAEKLREVTKKRLEKAEEMTLQELREAGKTLETAQKIGRTALGIEGGAPLPRAPRWCGAPDASLQEWRDEQEKAEIEAALLASGLEKEMAWRVAGHMTDEERAELTRGGSAEALREAMWQAIEDVLEEAKAAEGSETPQNATDGAAA